MYLYVGIALIVFGLVLLLAGRSKSKNASVEASNGSVAIGGTNSGPIVNTHTGAPHTSQEPHWLTVLAIVVELAGIGVVIWQAYHLAAK